MNTFAFVVYMTGLYGFDLLAQYCNSPQSVWYFKIPIPRF